MKEIAIQITGLKKMYKLGQIGGGSLQADLQSWWARVRGKEDPNSKIGSDQRSNGKTFMALNGIDMTVYKGEALGIIGHNGAGKSTLLKLLSRVTAPTEGEIGINGRIASMLEVGTGFNGEMTGRENVYMNGAILGMTRAEVDTKMEQIIEFSEVREFIDTPVKRYSSGMYVKLAFSVAAHLDSEIMIMDEVLAVGDMAFQKKCLDKMREAARQEGRTVLYVSHNMNTIRQLCDRCVVLDKGRVAFEGEVEQAIGVYMEKKAIQSGSIDVANIPRSPEFKDGSVRFQKIYSPSNPNGRIQVGGSFDICADIKAFRDIENVNFRIVFKALDSSPVSMFPSANGFSFSKGGYCTLSFHLDLSRFVPGKYTLGFVAYYLTKDGVHYHLDGLNECYNVNIEPIAGFNRNMEWSSRYWGYTYSTPINIIITKSKGVCVK